MTRPWSSRYFAAVGGVRRTIEAWKILVGVALVSTPAMLGCGGAVATSDRSDGSAIGDGDLPTDAVPDPDETARVCGAPYNDAPVVAIEWRATPFEDAAGGPLVAGRYQLAKVELMGDPAPGTRKYMRTLLLGATTWAESDREPTVSTTDWQWAGNLATAGTRLTRTRTCGYAAGETSEWAYTSDGSKLLLMPIDGSAPTLRYTYARR